MPINQSLEQGWNRNREQVTYTGRWVIVGAGGLPTTKIGGLSLNLARTGAGLYTVTLDQSPAAIIGVSVRTASNTHVINVLTVTALGATLRAGLIGSPATPGELPATDSVMVTLDVLRSLIR